MTNSTLTPGVNNDEWNQAAGKARDAAACMGEMAGHAASAVGAMASQAACDVGMKADELAASAGFGIQGMGDRLSKNAPHGGVLESASQMVAQSVKDGGQYLEEAKFSGLTEDVAQLVRRNPIPAILIAIGLGWFVGRKMGS